MVLEGKEEAKVCRGKGIENEPRNGTTMVTTHRGYNREAIRAVSEARQLSYKKLELRSPLLTAGIMRHLDPGGWPDSLDLASHPTMER